MPPPTDKLPVTDALPLATSVPEETVSPAFIDTAPWNVLVPENVAVLLAVTGPPRYDAPPTVKPVGLYSVPLTRRTEGGTIPVQGGIAFVVKEQASVGANGACDMKSADARVIEGIYQSAVIKRDLLPRGQPYGPARISNQISGRAVSNRD